jgi:oligopeptide/dipeptide ABC transporter ATP-binding protein
LVLVVAGVIIGPLLIGAGPLDQDLNNVLAGPTAQHWLGTDALGRDVLSRLLTGGRPTLSGALTATAVFLAVGVPLGILAGYIGSWVDRGVTLLAELLFATPGIIIVLVVLAVFGNSTTIAMVTLGVLSCGGLIRVLRGGTMALKNELYVRAARTSGLTEPQIVRRHILPRLAGPILVQAFLFAGAAIIVQTSLGFLGFGAPPPAPSWGSLVTDASQAINTHPWLLVPTGTTIVLTVLAFGLVGDLARDLVVDRSSASARPAGPSPTDLASDHLATTAPSVPETATTATTAPAPGVLLSVRGLTVTAPSPAGPVAVVRNVDLDVATGEIVGVVGESGCGKSVTSMAVLGLLKGQLKVSSGTIAFNGVDLQQSTPRERRRLCGAQIAFISQEPIASLDPAFPVGRQLRDVVRRHQDVSRRQASGRVLELLRLVQLDEPEQVARKYPHQLSGGMAQRIGIAAALAGDPALLIADEPTTALDVTVQAEVLSLLAHLRKTMGMAVLLVTHDFGVLAEVCDRAVVMYAGEVVETAPVTDLLADPAMPYSAALLQSNPVTAPLGAYLPSIGGTVPAPHEWPVGCHFQDRCVLATPRCAVAPVPVFRISAERTSRCLRVDELGDLLEIGARTEAIPHFLRSPEAAGEPLLEIEGLSVIYTAGKDRQKAVDDVTLSLRQGRTLGLVGGSGAGKSTLGAAVLGLVEPSDGRIAFDGRDITHLPRPERRALTRDIQVVFQDPYNSLNPARTVRQTLEEPLRLNLGLDASDARARVDQLLNQVGVPLEAANRYPAQFSGGQRQRIAIARALAVRPRLIVCDEAVSALDLSVQAQVLNLLKKLQIELGLTYLFVSHDLDVVRHMADDIAILQHGRLREFGPAEQVYNNPQHAYTRTLLDAVPGATRLSHARYLSASSTPDDEVANFSRKDA